MRSMTVVSRQLERERTSLNLRMHHSQCELNYHLCMGLVPGCRSGETEWRFQLDNQQKSEVLVQLLESAPYTTTVDLIQETLEHHCLPVANIKIRLYHDVEMAEVVSWDKHRHWRPIYDYPNRHMYQRDEKLVLNRYLGELLAYCRKLGIARATVCESIRINKN